jgi:hypothetical protein
MNKAVVQVCALCWLFLLNVTMFTIMLSTQARGGAARRGNAV